MDVAVPVRIRQSEPPKAAPARTLAAFGRTKAVGVPEHIKRRQFLAQTTNLRSIKDHLSTARRHVCMANTIGLLSLAESWAVDVVLAQRRLDQVIAMRGAD